MFSVALCMRTGLPGLPSNPRNLPLHFLQIRTCINGRPSNKRSTLNLWSQSSIFLTNWFVILTFFLVSYKLAFVHIRYWARYVWLLCMKNFLFNFWAVLTDVHNNHSEIYGTGVIPCGGFVLGIPEDYCRNSSFSKGALPKERINGNLSYSHSGV